MSDHDQDLRHDGAEANDPLAPAQEHFARLLRERVGALVQGGAEDVAKYAAAMSVDLAFAAATQDDRAMRHLAAQAKHLGEKHRLVASRAVWSTLADLTYDLASTLAVGLAVAL